MREGESLEMTVSTVGRDGSGEQAEAAGWPQDKTLLGRRTIGHLASHATSQRCPGTKLQGTQKE